MVGVALPIMSSHFNAGSQISWVANAAFVYVAPLDTNCSPHSLSLKLLFSTNTAFQLVYGRLSDIWARKAALFVLMLIFGIGNVAAGASRTLIELLVFRAVSDIPLSHIRVSELRFENRLQALEAEDFQRLRKSSFPTWLHSGNEESIKAFWYAALSFHHSILYKQSLRV